jgi:hypothetical protein
VLYTNYKFEGEKVLLTVRLVPSVEIMLQDDGRRGKGK